MKQFREKIKSVKLKAQISHLPRFEQNKGIYQKMDSIAFKCLLNPNFKPAEKRYRYTDKRTDRKTNGKTNTRTEG